LAGNIFLKYSQLLCNLPWGAAIGFSIGSPKGGSLMHCSHQEEKGALMDPDRIIDGLSKELNSALKAMAKAKDVNEKESYSRIIKNLCESLGVFFNLASEMMSLDDDDFE
jgi:hypothetical protein